MNLVEIAVWVAVGAFLALRVAMLAAFIALPVAVVRMIHRHGLLGPRGAAT